MTVKRALRRFVPWVVILAAAGVGLALYLRRDSGAGQDLYRSEPLEKGDVTMTVTATGTLSAVTTVQVGSQVSGIIAALHADFNSPVKKGQMVAELDPTPFAQQVAQRRADLTNAQVQLRNAEINFDRQKKLLAEQLAAQADFDSAQAAFDGAKAQVDQSRAALDQAETSLKYTKIVSPIDGVVVDRQYDVGQTVAASFQAPTLFTIAQDLTKMQVQADVDQSDIGRIKVGQMAHFTVDAYPEEQFRGNITQIRLNATVNQNVITYPVIITVSNPGEKLRPKMTADVSIDVETVHDVLRVANAALRFRPTNGSQEGGGSFGGARAGGGQGSAMTGGTGAAGSSTSGRGLAGAGASSAGGGAGPSQWRAGGGGRTRGEAGTQGGNRGSGGSRAETGASQAPGGATAGAGGSGEGGFEQKTARLGENAGTPSGMAAALEGVMGGAGKAGRGQTVYLLGDRNQLKPVQIRTGISDGRYTVIVDGPVKPGDRVVTGMATAKVDESRRGPGMRMF